MPAVWVRAREIGVIIALLVALLPGPLQAVSSQESQQACGLEDGRAYQSPTYGYILAATPPWQVEECFSQDGYDVFRVTNGVSDVVLEGARNRARDAESCLQRELDRLKNERDDIEDFSLLGQNPLQVQVGIWSGVSEGYTYTLFVDNQAPQSLYGIKWCALLERGVSLVLTEISPIEGFAEQVKAVGELLSGLQPPEGMMPAPPAADAQEARREALLRYIEVAAADVDEFWERTFPTLSLAGGSAYAPPTAYQPYEGEISMACGTVVGGSFLEGAGHLYCPLDQTVYIDLVNADEETQLFGLVAVTSGIAHEAGHHVQRLLEIEMCRSTPCLDDRQLTSRELENMADCFSGAWVADAELSGELGSSDVGIAIGIRSLYMGEQRRGAADPGLHGTSAERTRAFLQGYDNGAEACLTAIRANGPVPSSSA